jgi:hypothetical protein
VIGHTLFAWMPENVGKPEQWLAVIGGAALGAFVVGLTAQLLSRWLTTRKLPPWAVNTLRVLGAVALGLLTAMWVWNGGGWGLFGPGGPGGPGGTDKDGHTSRDKPTADKDKGGSSNTDEDPPPPVGGEAVRVAVLSNEAVEKRMGKKGVDQKSFYRLSGKDELLTLGELADSLKKQIADRPLKRIDIDLTQPGSPAQGTERVGELVDWAVRHDVAPYFVKKKAEGAP